MNADIGLNAEITKLNFLLENLYAVVIRNGGGTPSDVEALKKDLRMQFTTVELTGSADREWTKTLMVGADLMDLFFDRVGQRLASD